MKRIRYCLYSILMLCFISFTCVWAESVVSLSIRTDRDSYQKEDVIHEVYEITNHNPYVIENVKLDVECPSGYVPVFDGPIKIDHINSMEQVSIQAHLQPATIPEQIIYNVKTGISRHFIIIIVIIVFWICLTGFLLFQRKKKIFSFLIVLGLGGSLCSSTTEVQAASNLLREKAVASQIILIDGNSVELNASIHYEYNIANDDGSTMEDGKESIAFANDEQIEGVEKKEDSAKEEGAHLENKKEEEKEEESLSDHKNNSSNEEEQEEDSIQDNANNSVNDIKGFISPSLEKVDTDENGVVYYKDNIIIFLNKKVDNSIKNKIENITKGSIIGQLKDIHVLQVKIEDSNYSTIQSLCDSLKELDFVKDAMANVVMSIELDESNPWKDKKDNEDKKNHDENEKKPDGNNWWAEQIGAYTAWKTIDEQSVSLKEVGVGIIDKGFDLNHEDINSKEIKLLGKVDDQSSHGLAVTGIIAALNNTIGIRGIADSSNVYFSDVQTLDSKYYISGSDYLNTINQMLKQDVRVINLSFSFERVPSKDIYSKLEKNSYSFNGFKEIYFKGDYNSYLSLYKNANKERQRFCLNALDALKQKYEDNFLFVISCGNGIQEDKKLNSGLEAGLYYEVPFGFDKEIYNEANCDYSMDELRDSLLFVGGTKKQSNKLVDGCYGDLIDIVAPSSDIFTLGSDNKEESYQVMNGTSLATPMVSGSVALLWQMDPDLKPSEIKDILLDNANTAKKSNSKDSRKKYPMLNIGKAIQSMVKVESNIKEADYVGTYCTDGYSANGVEVVYPYLPNGSCLIIESIKNNKISFMITSSSNNNNVLYNTQTITASLDGNKANFNWTDSWNNEGKGTITLNSSFDVTVYLEETKKADSNRGSLPMGSTHFVQYFEEVQEEPVETPTQYDDVMMGIYHAFEHKEYDKAEQLNLNLPSTISQYCDPNAKQAFMDIVNSYKDSSENGFYDYFLVDMDLDGISELIVESGTCEADVAGHVYKFENGQANELGMIALSHSTVHATNNTPGLILHTCHQGYEVLYFVHIENGQIITDSTDYREAMNYIPLGNLVPSHFVDMNTIDLSDLQ